MKNTFELMASIATVKPSNFGLLFLVCVIGVVLPYGFLSYAQDIKQDSGVFMYTGQVIASGGLPYLDSWDHKGPLLYLLNALGFYLFNQSHGVTIIEGIFLFIAIIISSNLWAKIVSLKFALIVTTVFIISYYSTFQGGNLTESWTVPFQLITYSLAFVVLADHLDQVERTALFTALAVALGLSLGAILFIRPNNALGLMALGIIILFLNKGSRLKFSFIAGISFLAIVIPILNWMYQHQILDPFYEQYLQYNRIYSKDGFKDFGSRFNLLKDLFFTPLGLLTISLSLYAWVASNRVYQKKHLILFASMLFVFIVDVASMLVSGKEFLHYIAISCVSLALTSLSLILVCEENCLSLKNNKISIFFGSIFLFATILTGIRPAYYIASPLMYGTAFKWSAKNELATYLTSRTEVTDMVLVHGADTWLLVATNRRSPTSITYYYPVIYNFSKTRQQYENEVLAARPTYIVEASGSCGLSRHSCAIDPTMFANIRTLQQKEYFMEKEIQGFLFWRRKD